MARRKKKKIEFSKALAILNTIVYLLVLLFCLGAWLVKDSFPSEIFMAVTTQYATTLSVYMIKAGYENGKKYNNESERVDI
jgi:positive regulator of sigma E activity